MLTFLRKIRKSLIETGSVRKYLLYAIGEILLVMIGILLALQVNNWNENSKNQVRIKNNFSGLIADLLNDSIAVSQSLISIEKDMELLNEYKFRLSNSGATLDTLKQIARYEFSPIVNVWPFRYNNVYNTVVMSGEMNLFDENLTKEINSYYSAYDDLNYTDQSTWDVYLNTMQQYAGSFTHSLSLVNSGPVADAIWANANMTNLGPKFFLWASTKRLYYTQMKNKIQRSKDKNSNLLALLRAHQVDLD